MAIGTWSPDGKLGAVALKAAGLITEDTMGTAVYFGKGKFRIVTDITVLEIASDNELYFIDIEANTSILAPHISQNIVTFFISYI